MFNVGVHMLSLAGEHLLVQICFMFLFLFVLLLMFVLGVFSPIQRGGETKPTPWPTQIHGKYPLITQEKTHLNIKLLCFW